MTDSTTPEVSIVAVTAGTSESSTTTRLASDILTAAQTRAAQVGMRARIHLIDLKPLAQDIATALGTGFHTDSLRAAQDALGAADAAVLATPVYKASYSGLFKSFLDVADDDIVTATPVVLAATAGTPRHGLVPNTDMRALLSYMRAVIAPTTVFAATEDWANPAALEPKFYEKNLPSADGKENLKKSLLRLLGFVYLHIQKFLGQLLRFVVGR